MMIMQMKTGKLFRQEPETFYDISDISRKQKRGERVNNAVENHNCATSLKGPGDENPHDIDITRKEIEMIIETNHPLN